jgi:hypothetical protein
MRLRKLYRRFPDAAKELELVYLACPGHILSSSIAEMGGRFL